MDFELYFAGMQFRNTFKNSDRNKLIKFMFDRGYNSLLSYTNNKKEIIERFNRPDYKGKFFIDSGAFSLWTKGKQVNVDEYIAFLNEHKHQIDLHGQVDIIPGVRGQVTTLEQVTEAAKLTWENYLYMIERLDHPDKCLYTFHIDEPFEYLKQALERRDDNGKLIPYIALGEDPNREGLKETPKRVTKMYEEVFEGIQYTNKEIAQMFNKCFEDVKTGDLVVVEHIPIFSYCEHHLALMYNMDVSVGYIPKNKVIGLSKIARIADMVGKRLQLQERIGMDIMDILKNVLETEDIIVVIKGEHACLTSRGIKKPNTITKTSAIGGRFKKDFALRQEFYNLI